MEATATYKPSLNGAAISKDVAEKEVIQWLDAIGATEDQKTDLKTNIGILVSAVSSGHLVIDHETQEITQKLKVPFGLEIKIKELKFNTDLRLNTVNEFKKNIGQEVDNRNMIAYVCASTGNLASVIQQMNMRDFNVSSAIVLFFVM